MTLTVRLDVALESALDRYSAERGVTKSHVVQEALAVYLTPRVERAGRPKAPSENYKAFDRAGLIGAGELGGVSATNDAVRERVMEHLRRKPG